MPGKGNAAIGYEGDHVIIHGPCPLTNRARALEMLKDLSPSSLKYDRKIVHHGEKHAVNIMLSDVHYEIDMSVLGKSARSVWHQIHATIIDSIKASCTKRAVIMCKSFNGCCPDLVRVFFSYLQRPMLMSVQTSFILLTSHYAFLPSSIRSRCRAVSAPSKLIGANKLTPAPLCKRVLGCITGEINILDLRSVLYEIQIYLFSIDVIGWCLVQQITQQRTKQKNPLTCEELSFTVRHIIQCSYSYNTCYRPIFHLEKLALGLARIVNA